MKTAENKNNVYFHLRNILKWKRAYNKDDLYVFWVNYCDKTEAATRDFLLEKLFWEILQSSQENQSLCQNPARKAVPESLFQ